MPTPLGPCTRPSGHPGRHQSTAKRSEELLGDDGDVAALRVMLSDRTPAEKQAELARLAKVFAKAVGQKARKKG